MLAALKNSCGFAEPTVNTTDISRLTATACGPNLRSCRKQWPRSRAAALKSWVLRSQAQRRSAYFEGQASVLVSRVLAGYILSGDVLEIPLQFEAPAGTEILVHKNSNSKSRDIYQAPIGYVTKPKEDRRGQFYSLAEARQSALGFSMVRLNCDVVRDYFYVA